MKVNEEEIASLMPQIYRKLEWLDKEDIIKRVVSLEFNRMIDYYKDADEIQQVDATTSEHRSMYSYVRLSIDRCTATYV